MEKENMTTPREAAQGADARTGSGAAAPAADLGKFKSVDGREHFAARNGRPPAGRGI